jgi:peptidoglycan/LPS O-acetylase OafA/YrhL
VILSKGADLFDHERDVVFFFGSSVKLSVERPAVESARVTAIDGLRGLLAVVVLAWHVCAPFGINWMLMPANLAVGLFFVLSSYVLTRSWEGRFGLFLARRLVRLWPVYAVCLAVGYIIAGVQPVWSEFLWYPLIGPNDETSVNPPMWSLFLEVWAMPFMPLIVWSSSDKFRGIVCAAAAILVGLIVPQVSILCLFVIGASFSHISFRNRLLEAAIPQWLGRISYSLYLSHALVLKLFVGAFGAWGGVLAIPAAFCIGWLTWWGVERPSIKLSRKVGRMAVFRVSSIAT